MEKFVIRGGAPLHGDVNIGGAKNAAVAILPATILAADKCLIENLPCISDVMASLQILSELGASIRMVSRSTYNKQVILWVVDGLPVPARILQKKDGKDELDLVLKSVR